MRGKEKELLIFYSHMYPLIWYKVAIFARIRKIDGIWPKKRLSPGLWLCCSTVPTVPRSEVDVRTDDRIRERLQNEWALNWAMNIGLKCLPMFMAMKNANTVSECLRLNGLLASNGLLIQSLKAVSISEMEWKSLKSLTLIHNNITEWLSVGLKAKDSTDFT